LPPRTQAHLLAFLGQVGDQRFVVFRENLRADGHLEHHVLAAAPVRLRPMPCRTALPALKCCW
jgi:hypothetical protein